MKFKPVKGTRDFYPEQMRVRNWIADTWRKVSLRNGFEEYEAPIFEYLDLFTAKSGQEIADQLFNFTDRGGRRLAIRPEITPSLARMVNEKINSLPRPIKWFSIPRLCRAENPQKGRLREFFQWNIDIIGPDTPLADAECVFTAVDALRELGLNDDEVEVRYSSRSLTTEAIKFAGVAKKDIEAVLGVIDKRNKVKPDAWEKILAEVVPENDVREKILKFLGTGRAIEEATDAETAALATGLNLSKTITPAIEELIEFKKALVEFGVDQWCRYDPGVVRGLAYYTGIVYEIFDAEGQLRAVVGGGRYDNLLAALGGPDVPATGFGMGDAVLEILLEEKGKIPKDLRRRELDYFVIDGAEELFADAVKLVGVLRQKGFSADFGYKRQSVGKQMKEANRRGAANAVIVRDGELAIKDLATGEQIETSMEKFLSNPKAGPAGKK